MQDDKSISTNKFDEKPHERFMSFTQIYLNLLRFPNLPRSSPTYKIILKLEAGIYTDTSRLP